MARLAEAAANSCDAGIFDLCSAFDTKASTVTLTAVNGGCGIVAGGTRLMLASDGTLLVNGKVAGSWQSTGNGFTASTEDGTVTCSRGVAGSSGSGSGGATGTKTSVADAG